MKYREILEKIKSGEFTINKCGHRLNVDEDYLVERYEDTIKLAAGSNDGKWSKGVTDEGMREMYARELDWECEIDEMINRTREFQCFACGETMALSFNGSGLSANKVFRSNPTDWRKSDYFTLDCQWENRGPYSIDINITSGEMILCNWMLGDDEERLGDCKKEDNYTPEFSLNAESGRFGIANFKSANQNIGYTQTDSCGSVRVFCNRKRNPTHLFLASYFDEEDEPKCMDGFKGVGRVDICVWRVEVTDVKNPLISLDKIKEKWNTTGDYTDAAILKVPNGKWTMTSYYDRLHSESNSILAEIKYENNNL